jgi:hypothetical protein
MIFAAQPLQKRCGLFPQFQPSATFALPLHRAMHFYHGITCNTVAIASGPCNAQAHAHAHDGAISGAKGKGD